MNPEFTVFMVFGPTKGLPMGLWDINLRKQLTGAFYVGLLDGLLGVAGMIITSDYGSFPHSLLSTSKTKTS